MLELKKGVDILTELGGIKSIDDARKLLQDNLDQEHLARVSKIKNEEALLKIANAIALCQPDSVYITLSLLPRSTTNHLRYSTRH